LVIKHIAGTQKCFPIYSEVNNIHILDLVQSATCLKEANAYLESSAREGKSFLFVGTKRQASTCKETLRVFYVNHRWLGGMLTNWSTLKNELLT
jgi:small subunit ribosomal protein S2